MTCQVRWLLAQVPLYHGCYISSCQKPSIHMSRTYSSNEVGKKQKWHPCTGLEPTRYQALAALTMEPQGTKLPITYLLISNGETKYLSLTPHWVTEHVPSELLFGVHRKLIPVATHNGLALKSFRISGPIHCVWLRRSFLLTLNSSVTHLCEAEATIEENWEAWCLCGPWLCG